MKMAMQHWMLVSSVVVVILLFTTPQVVNHLASTEAAAAAAPYVKHALDWMTNLSLPEVLTYLGQAQALWNGGSIKDAAEKIAAEKAAAEKAAAEKAAAEKAAAEQAATDRSLMKNDMTSYFAKVQIKREDLHEAERALKGDLADEWEEKVIEDTSIGIAVDKFEGFVDDMIEEFGMKKNASDKLKKQFMKIKDMDYKERKVWEFVLEEKEISSHFGYVSFKKDSRGKIDAVYAIHAIHAKLADRVIRTTTKTEYGLFMTLWTKTEITETKEPVKFGTKQIDQIRNHYLRNRALVAFKENGMLDEINYI